MYIIIESNGGVYIGAVLKEDGYTMNFNTEEEAIAFAEKNCAFNWKVIKI